MGYPADGSFRWIHLDGTHLLWWPFELDIRETVQRMGGCDAIFVTGNVSVLGASIGFEVSYDLIHDFRGSLVVVPGNNDAQREPSELTFLFGLWHDPAVRDKFWDPASELRALVDKAFANFDAYSRRVMPAGTVRGRLPGDFSVSLPSVRVIGLNTAFSMIGGDRTEGAIVDPRQIAPLCDPSSTVPSHKWFVFTGLKFSEWPSDTPVLIRRQVEGWANRSVEWVATRPRRPETLSPPRRAFGHETRIPCR
ncbi:MAG: hypothetical protein FJW39_23035 [Acidobacteria bacterium]|nr:hypothetical protein [Acidobacteriota bacterium]